jgi:outer membrane murein-binding lipoprotein Lpp
MKKATPLVGAALAAALLLSGCSMGAANDSMSSSDSKASTSSSVADTVNSDGAGLRAGLTALFSDHVYLAGAAIHAALAAGGDLTEAKTAGAVAALDANSVEIAAAIGSVYPDAEQPFLESWREHIGFFVNYTIGKATGDQAGADAAVADLTEYAASFGELLNSVVPTLPADAVEEALGMHATSLIAAIDADIAGDPGYYTLLKEAAGHMPMTATAIAGAIAKDQDIE